MKDGQIHKLMVSSEFQFDTSEAARKYFTDLCQTAIDHVNDLPKATPTT